MKKTTLILFSFVLLLTSCAYNKYEEDDVDMYLDWSGYWYYQGEESAEAYERSRMLAERALAEDPENLKAKLIYGYSLLKLRIWENTNPRKNSAKKVFTEIIEKEPENYRAHLGLGITNIKLCKKYTGKLRDFQRLIEDANFLLDRKKEIDKLEKEEQDISEKEILLLRATNEWFEKIKLVVDGEIFPYDEYKSLVKKENPSIAEIQDALGKRIDELVKATNEAMMDYPFNYEFYVLNLNKIKLIFEVAEKYYKNEYRNLIDNAEREFNHCLELHDKYHRVYFWVYDYLSILYAVKATLEPDNEKLVQEYHGLERDYLIKYIIEDQKFERKRREKITSDKIDELEENPFFTNVSEDYQSMMVSLIDSARVARQNKIIMLISLLANVFKDYTRAMEWVEQLKITEERLSNPEAVEPFLFYYFRVKIYMLKSGDLEEKYPKLKNLAYISKSDRETIPEDVLENYRLIWEQIIDNGYNFIKNSSIYRNNVERNEIDAVMMESLNRYPELYRYPEDQ